MRRLAPKAGHVFFFPNRAVGKRIIAGQQTLIWPFESWKHIQVGGFDFELGESREELECQTKDGMTCSVKGRVWLSISEKSEEDLAQISVTFPPSKNLEDVADLKVICKGAATTAESIVRGVISGIEYLTLLQEYSKLEQIGLGIVELFREQFPKLGIGYVGSDIKIEPSAPSGIRASRQMLNQWVEFDVIRQEQKVRMEQRRLSYDNELELLRSEDKKLRSIRDFEFKKMSEELRVQADQLKLESDKKIAEIQEQMAILSLVSQKRNIVFDTEVNEEQSRKKFELEQKRIQFEMNLIAQRALAKREELTGELDSLDLMAQIEKKRSTVDDSKRMTRLSNLEVESKQMILAGEAERLQSLGKNAAAIAISRAKLDAIVALGKDLSQPLSKITEAKIMSIPGGSGSSTEFSSLAQLTALPIMREVLSFFDKTAGGDAGAENKPQSRTIASKKSGDSHEQSASTDTGLNS